MEQRVMPSFMQEEEPKSSDALQNLMVLAEAYLQQEAYVKELSAQLDNAKGLLNKLSTEEIPNLLRSHGLSRIKLANGMEVTVKEDINVTIKDEERFFKYLEETGQSDIIKTTVYLGRQDADLLASLHKFMKEEGIEYEEDTKVHAQTLKKFFRDKCGIGLDETERQVGYMKGTLTPPSNLPDWCTVFTIATTKIKK